jgi:uncharacterized protein (TIGR00369 family)
MSQAAELSELLNRQPKPVCADLTPFEIIEADFETGYLVLRFAPQPAFSNHWGNIQGGFGVALIDVVISVAVYAKRQQWCPTIEMKTTFIAPAKLGECKGEAQIIKIGKTFAFLEAKLWGADGQLAIQATATVNIRET